MSEPEILLGEYEVEKTLGVGGMGHVVLVKGRSTGERFAVKRTHLSSPEARTHLLAELQTWIDLPDIPHLVACRFFRTLGDEIAIFAEYVEGGALAEAIADRRLPSLEQILDVAIQLAWGLHAAHLLGVVHQDVKPSNVLLTLSQVVKVGDFGLARANQGSGAEYGGALTRGYCSPEQAELAARQSREEGRLTAATDQWSWGVTVLELFTGSPPCRYGGQFAGSVLESFLEQGGQETGLPQIPPLVVEVLRKCFQRQPSERWPSLEAAADILAIAYQMATGSPFPRAKPPWPTRSRQWREGTAWDDPGVWLRRVYFAAGEEPPESPPAVAGSLLARAVADLNRYEIALRRLTQLCHTGRHDLEPMLADLCLAKAIVHRVADDVPGAVRLVEHAIGLLAPRVSAGVRALTQRLIEAYLQGAACARLLGRFSDALDWTAKALTECERQGTPPGRRLGDAYLHACASRARTFVALEDYPAALAELERGRSMGLGLVQYAGRDDLEADLVELDLQTARALKDSGELAAATDWLDRTLPRLERLVQATGETSLRHQLAAATLTRARLLLAREDYLAAERDSERALTLWRDLAAGEDRSDLAGELAEALALQARLHVRQERSCAALPLYEQAQILLERLVGPGGRMEFLPALAQICVHRAAAHCTQGDAATALRLGERGVGILEGLVAEGRADLASDLAWAQAVQGHILNTLDQHEPALACWRTAVVLYEELVHVRGRWDLLPALLGSQRAEANLLGNLGRSHIARERLDQAIRVGSELIRSRETPLLVQELAALRIDRAVLLVEAGETSLAQQELCEVLLRLEHQPDAEPLRQRALTVLSRLW